MKLHTSAPMFGLPDPSPFSIKVMTLCKMAGIDFEAARMSLEEAPKGKMPYIETDNGLLGDSTFIRFYLERQGYDFDAGYDAPALALGWALEKMCEEHLYFAMVHARWMNEENFNKGPRQFFAMVPEAARDHVIAQAREKVKNNLLGHGLGRHSSDEIAQLAIKDMDAIATLLGDKDFILGDRPCGYDASIHACLWGVSCPLFDSAIGAYVRNHGVLMAYIERMKSLYYPD